MIADTLKTMPNWNEDVIERLIQLVHEVEQWSLTPMSPDETISSQVRDVMLALSSLDSAIPRKRLPSSPTLREVAERVAAEPVVSETSITGDFPSAPPRSIRPDNTARVVNDTVQEFGLPEQMVEDMLPPMEEWPMESEPAIPEAELNSGLDLWDLNEEGAAQKGDYKSGPENEEGYYVSRQVLEGLQNELSNLKTALSRIASLRPEQLAQAHNTAQEALRLHDLAHPTTQGKKYR